MSTLCFLSSIMLKHVVHVTSTEVCVFLGPKVAERVTSFKGIREMEDSAYIVSQKEGFFLGCLLCNLVLCE